MQADLSGAEKMIKSQDMIKRALEASGRAFDANGKVIGVNSTVTKQTLNGVSREVLLMNAKFQETNGTIQNVSGSFTRIGKNFALLKDSVKVTTSSINDLNNGSRGLESTLGKLIGRAALTIPVWFAIRFAISQVISVFVEATKRAGELDQALRRAISVLDDTDVNSKVAQNLKNTISELNQLTGKPIDEIGKAVLEFTTSGIDAEKATEGMTSAVKFATATFSDSVDAAKALVSMQIFYGDALEKNIPKQEEMNFMAALFKRTMDPARVSARQFIEGIEGFAGTAKTLGLTRNQVLALINTMNTLGVRGPEAVTSLRNAFLLLNQNSKRATEIVGEFLPTNNFEKIIKVIENFRERAAKGQDISKLFEEVFGVKATKGTAALVADLDRLYEALKRADDATADWNGTITDLNSDVKLQTDGIKSLEQQNIALFNTLKQGFLESILGAEAYESALKEINKTLKKLIDDTKAFGELGFFGKLGSFFENTSGPLGKGIGQGSRALASAIFKEKELSSDDKARIDAGAKARVQRAAKAAEAEAKKLAKTTSETSTGELTPANALTFEELLAFKEIESAKRRIGTEEIFSRQSVLLARQFNDELSDLVDTANSFQKDKDKQISAEALLGALRSGNAEDLQRFQDKDFITSQKILELRKQLLEVEKARANEIKQIADELAGSFSGGLEDLLKNKVGPKDFLTNFGSAVQDSQIKSASRGLTRALSQTGIFNQLGAAGVDLENALSATGNPVVDAINQSTTAIVNAIRQGPTGSAAQGALGAAGGLGGLFSGQGLQIPKGPNGQPIGLGQGLFNAGLAGVGGFLAGSQRGTTQGILGGAGGFLTSAAPFLGSLGPVGLIAGLGLTIASFFGGSKKTTQVQEQQRTNQIASKIDVTNKQLSIVNRNLVALKEAFETFILPDSAFFGAKRSLEDQFSLNARRGLV